MALFGGERGRVKVDGPTTADLLASSTIVGNLVGITIPNKAVAVIIDADATKIRWCYATTAAIAHAKFNGTGDATCGRFYDLPGAREIPRCDDKTAKLYVINDADSTVSDGLSVTPVIGEEPRYPVSL